jgi:hypothetical protein
VAGPHLLLLLLLLRPLLLLLILHQNWDLLGRCPSLLLCHLLLQMPPVP